MSEVDGRLAGALADRYTIDASSAAVGRRYIAFAMIEPSAALADLEARYQREAFRGLTYEQALARFTALWAEALALGTDFGADWRDDLAADLAVARAVNGLPPAS